MALSTDRASIPRTPRYILMGVLLGVVALVVAGTYAYFFPPMPMVVRVAGDRDKSYAPDVIGLDKEGWLCVNGKKYAAPIDGSFDEDALLEIAHSRWRWREKDELGYLKEWQVLCVEAEVPGQVVGALVDCLSRAQLARICFEVSATANPDSVPRLLHVLGTFYGVSDCGGDPPEDARNQSVIALPTWGSERYSWGVDLRHHQEQGDLLEFQQSLASSALISMTPLLRPEAAWGDALSLLCLLEDTGLASLDFPEVVPEDV
ncbi:MAG: hypothetical protein ACI8PQ_002606 [Planctomycetota bacterium]|jgi:hypothetical protein